MPEEDISLWKKITQGDVKSFNYLFDKYWQWLYNIVYWRVTDEDIAKDITQEVFITVWDKRGELQIKEGLKNYIAVMAKNKVINHFRKHQYNQDQTGNVTLSLYNNNYNDSAKNLEYKELENHYKNIVAQLPEKMRVIHLLAKDQDYSNQQIADKLNISLQTVKNQLTAAYKKIRNEVNTFLSKTASVLLIIAFILLQE